MEITTAQKIINENFLFFRSFGFWNLKLNIFCLQLLQYILIA